MRKAYVVLNPVAGKDKDPARIRESLAKRLSDKGLEWEIYDTTGREKLADVVKDALSRGFDLVIAAGGDGTVSGVAGGLVNTGIPLGIVPLGTGNALARELKIPLDLGGALELILDEHAVREIDSLEVNSRCVLMQASMGVGSRTMQNASREAKRRWGVIAYISAGLRELLDFRMPRFDVSIDDERYLFSPATELAVVNSGVIGASVLRWDENISMEDGDAAVCIVHARTLGDYLSLVGSLLVRGKKHRSHINCQPASREVVVKSRPPLPIQADGDVIGMSPLTAKVMPRSIRVIVPQDLERV